MRGLGPESKNPAHRIRVRGPKSVRYRASVDRRTGAKEEPNHVKSKYFQYFDDAGYAYDAYGGRARNQRERPPGDRRPRGHDGSGNGSGDARTGHEAHRLHLKTQLVKPLRRPWRLAWS